MPRGISAKREREYNRLKNRFKKSGRYKGREKEVAARIVNKQRGRYGETRAAKKKNRKGASPESTLPVKNYQRLTVGEVKNRLSSLSKRELRRIENYEKKHKNRKGVLRAVESRRLAAR